MQQFEKVNNYLESKIDKIGGVFIYLKNLTDFQKKEISFHNDIHLDEEEVHQLQSVRNGYYHNYFKKEIFQLQKDAIVLEIGAGSGFDAIDILKKDFNLIISDISEGSIRAIKQKIELACPAKKDKVIYLVSDGQHLPLQDKSIKAVYMVATLHHFENQQDLLSEILRILTSDGLFIMAMEPSRFMMKFTKLFSKANNLRIFNSHSEADETHQGYSKKDLRELLLFKNGARVKIKRVWLLLGFMHYGLEAIFRFFKLKKRLKIPKLFEWGILLIDELLLKIPVINKLNWHWIITIKY